MTEVLNIKYGSPDNAIYIGRPSKFGNPFHIGEHGSRKQVIQKYELYIKSNPELLEAVKTELKGKDLLCYCKPKSCHGDVLLKIANPELFEGLESFG